jgi:hypothetical protein
MVSLRQNEFVLAGEPKPIRLSAVLDEDFFRSDK